MSAKTISDLRQTSKILGFTKNKLAELLGICPNEPMLVSVSGEIPVEVQHSAREVSEFAQEVNSYFGGDMDKIREWLGEPLLGVCQLSPKQLVERGQIEEARIALEAAQLATREPLFTFNH